VPRLRELLDGVDVLSIDPPGAGELSIAGVRDDSRAVVAGDLFAALPGQTVDGHAFLEVAAQRGAVAAVVERGDAVFRGAKVWVRSTARALGGIARNLHGRPGEAMRLTGVTGTNGKTTISYLVESLLIAAGRRPGVIGTVAYRSPLWSRPAPFTTPTSLLLHATLAELRDAGCSDVVMECSSHALALDRLEGIELAAAAFTNLTQDHLDFHGDMESYAAAKARLFAERLRADGVAVVCVDGPFGEQMARASRARVVRVSAGDRLGDVRVRRARLDSDGSELELETPAGPLSVRSPLVGGFNVENLVVAIGLGLGLGLGLEEIASALATARGAPGRLERVAVDGVDLVGYVDYAHTPDALERALAALRPATRGKLWVVFGCGGDRDRGKRARMGAIAAQEADRVIVTSDNPRSEPPQQIIDEILLGSGREAHIEAVLDRQEAIDRAATEAAPGDVILVAGKGHEDYQIVGKERRHFDDREVLAEALQRRA
jgi:UDP-N-acetylmuramoyl-L-alanyl-D-glutamate--2,6-diaminopimelate ligase